MLETKEMVVQEQTSSLETRNVQGMIHIIRGKQVMIDSDLATLYQVETGALNRAVKRNNNRFPEDFKFQLTKAEYTNLKCQNGISSENEYGGRRTLPYAFTEQGISMLSGVLKSDIAVNVSIGIMRTFVEMRKYMASTSLLYSRVNEMEERQIIYQNETNERFDKVFAYISDHEESQQKIFFDGQIYDAFSLLINIVSGATKCIVLVDNYVDVGTFNQQYPSLEVRYTGAFHDRFLIIDNKKAYHIGASLKDAGKKCFAISILNESGVICDILQRLDIESSRK